MSASSSAVQELLAKLVAFDTTSESRSSASLRAIRDRSQFGLPSVLGTRPPFRAADADSNAFPANSTSHNRSWAPLHSSRDKNRDFSIPKSTAVIARSIFPIR